MNEKTLKKLEYDKIMDILSKECSSSLGKELVEQLTPSRDLGVVAARQKETTEAREVLMMQPNFSLGGIRNVKDAVALAQKNGVFSSGAVFFFQNEPYPTIIPDPAQFFGRRPSVPERGKHPGSA